MKTVEQLIMLSKNPFYIMSEAEKQLLEEGLQTEKVSSVSVDNKKKVSQTSLGNASVKEIGKIDKHPSDPTTE